MSWISSSHAPQTAMRHCGHTCRGDSGARASRQAPQEVEASRTSTGCDASGPATCCGGAGGSIAIAEEEEEEDKEEDEDEDEEEEKDTEDEEVAAAAAPLAAAAASSGACAGLATTAAASVTPGSAALGTRTKRGTGKRWW